MSRSRRWSSIGSIVLPTSVVDGPGFYTTRWDVNQKSEESKDGVRDSCCGADTIASAAVGQSPAVLMATLPPISPLPRTLRTLSTTVARSVSCICG